MSYGPDLADPAGPGRAFPAAAPGASSPAWPGPRAPARALGLLTLCALSLAGLAASRSGHAEADARRRGHWSGGAGAGFLANTPDGVEPAFSGHVDYRLVPGLSVGLSAQHAGAGGNDSLIGLSAQVKYRWDIPGTRGSARLVLQGGIGFVRADVDDDDSGVRTTYGSFLIPVGIGIDCALAGRVALTAELLLNFVSLGESVRVGGREFDLRTTVMPGLYLGVRF